MTATTTTTGGSPEQRAAATGAAPDADRTADTGSGPASGTNGPAENRRESGASAAASDVMAATPYLSVGGAAGMLEFLRRAFGAREVERYVDTDGRIGHAEVQIGALSFNLADESEGMAAMGVRSPRQLGGTSVHFFVQAADLEAAVERAVAAGARVVEPISAARGGRRCRLADPFGFLWTIVTR